MKPFLLTVFLTLFLNSPCTTQTNTVALQDQNIAEVYYQQGTVKLKNKQYAEAIDDYRSAIKLQPRDWRPHYGLGTALYRTQRYNEAGEAYKEALRLNSESAMTHDALGSVISEVRALGGFY